MQALVLLTLLLLPTLGSAQSLQPKEKSRTEKNAPVPKEHLPPPGMCRIWIDNVPAARQPAPTDCPTAIRNRPPNGRVIFPAARDDRPDRPKSTTPNRRPDTTKKKPPR